MQSICSIKLFLIHPMMNFSSNSLTFLFCCLLTLTDRTSSREGHAARLKVLARQWFLPYAWTSSTYTQHRLRISTTSLWTRVSSAFKTGRQPACPPPPFLSLPCSLSSSDEILIISSMSALNYIALALVLDLRLQTKQKILSRLAAWGSLALAAWASLTGTGRCSLQSKSASLSGLLLNHLLPWLLDREA